MAAAKKQRPTEDEMKVLLHESLERINNAPCAAKYKPPENLTEIRKQTPIFMGGVLTHGFEQSRKRTKSSKYFESAQDMENEIEGFFELCKQTNSPPNVGLLSAWFGITRETLNQWESDPMHPLADTTKKAKDIIRAWNTYMAQTNQISAIMAMFSQKTEHGVIEQQYINITAQPGQQRPETISDADFARQAIEAGKLQVLGDGTVV